MARVLVVDDEPMVREVVSRYLELDGNDVDAVGDGAAALEAFAAGSPDLVVLDVMLPHVGGFDVLAEIRRRADTPVILLTAIGDEEERVRGLDLGADDYVVKPFSAREVAARVRNILRRATPGTARVEVAGLSIDPSRRAAEHEGRPLQLTRREFDLLAFLAASPGQVFSRGQLLRQVWDSSPDWQDPATVTVHIRRLRNKLGGARSCIETVWGVGYRLSA